MMAVRGRTFLYKLVINEQLPQVATFEETVSFRHVISEGKKHSLSLCSVRVHAIWLESWTPGLRQELGSWGKSCEDRGCVSPPHTPVPMQSLEDQEEEVVYNYHKSGSITKTGEWMKPAV